MFKVISGRVIKLHCFQRCLFGKVWPVYLLQILFPTSSKFSPWQYLTYYRYCVYCTRSLLPWPSTVYTMSQKIPGTLWSKSDAAATLWRNFCSLAHQQIWSASLAFVLSLHFAPLVPFSQSNFDALVTFISGQRPSANSRSREKVIGWNFPLALLRLRRSTSKCQVQSILIVSHEITDHSATVVFSAPFVPALVLDVYAAIIHVDCRKARRNADGN